MNGAAERRTGRAIAAELTLIAAGCDTALARHDPARRLPALERMLTRGDVRAAAPLPRTAVNSRWQRMVVAAIGATDDPPSGLDRFPSAPVTWLGCDGPATRGIWLHAAPVHVATLADRLQLARVDDLAATEETELARLLEVELSGPDFRFESRPPGGWFLHVAHGHDITTTPLELALYSDLRESLPGGAGASALRRLMTEVQMLLHEHPINAAREAGGRLPVNAVWLWGGGLAPAPAAPRGVVLMGDDPFMRGLARLHGQTPVRASPAVLRSPSRDGERIVLVVDVDTLGRLDEEWLAPLLESVPGGRYVRVLLGLERWWVTFTGRDLRRFWKRTRAAAEVLV